MLGRSTSSVTSACAVMCRRAQSTAAAVAPAAAAPAAVSSAPKVLTTAEAAARGLVVTPSWSRYNVGAYSRSFGLAEARKLPILSTVTEQLEGRKAIIHRVSQHALTSGQGGSRWWAIRVNHVNKWANPLMSWLSSADTVAPICMHLRFESAEQAILFCERHALSYEVNPGATNARTPGRVDNLYQYNFVSKEVMAQMKALGPRKSREIYANPYSGKSAWINLRRTQFGTEPWKPADYQTNTAWTGPAWPVKKTAHTEEEHSH